MQTVPLIAQVPDVVATTQQEKKEGEKDKSKEIVEISQVLPGYARSYAVDYVPNEVRQIKHQMAEFPSVWVGGWWVMGALGNYQDNREETSNCQNNFNDIFKH